MRLSFNCIFGIIFFVGLFTSCSNEPISSEITQVKYGTSFGMCVGYCKHELLLKSDKATYNLSGWNATVEPITYTEVLNSSDWNLVTTNLNIKDFFDLPEMIGCPDCADGGAEWIEIELPNGSKHKVTFEYNNEPALLKNTVVELRGLMNKHN